MHLPLPTRRRLIALFLALVCLTLYFSWPWLRVLPQRFGPLYNYRVYEPSVRLDGIAEPTLGGWREPHSRWELLTTPDHQVLDAKKTVELIHRQQKFRRPTPQLPLPLPMPPTPTATGDELTDFVIDFGDSFGYPTSHQQLDEAIAQGKSYRASAFFMPRFHSGDKPFYGRLPTWLCYGDSPLDRGQFRANQFFLNKDFKQIDVGLDTPKQPTVFIVAGSGVYGAQKAVYDHAVPVAHSGETFWAAVYAGESHSSPRAFLLDRVTIAQSNTEILVHKPRPGGATADIYPYWFFVPLGNVPYGKYTVNVRLVDDNSLMATTTADLRAATKEENASRSAESMKLQQAGNEHYEKKQQRELEHGAALQLQLERVAEFVHSAQLADADRELLQRDVEQLGEAVDWNLDIYDTQHDNKRSLAPATPGKPPDTTPLAGALDMSRPAWSPSDIQLSDIWLCDVTDALWYAKKTYRSLPELEGGVTAQEPSAAQQKIRAICRAIADKGGPRHGAKLLSCAAAGTIQEALDAAYAVEVEDQPPVRQFPTKSDKWAVVVARRSFLIRRVDSRMVVDSFSKTKRREFRVSASAYIAQAEDPHTDTPSPITLAIIPLGKQDDVDSVGVYIACDSICSRQVGADPPQLIEANLPELIGGDFSSYLGSGTGFSVSTDAAK